MIVKKLRQHKGWSQEQLAALCNLNVRTIQRVEKGNPASKETLNSLASVFEVTMETLTAEVGLIDKDKALWQKQPWWFRLAFFGISSRKIQARAETSLIFLAVLTALLADNKFISTGLFLAAYLTTLSIRHGDQHDLW